MAATPKTSLIGRGIVGGMVSGSGADAAAPAAPAGPSKTSQIGFGLVGLLVIGLGGGGAAPAPPAGNTGGTVASAAQAGTAGVVDTTRVRVTQEVIEAVVEPSPTVRVTQEVLEAVVFSGTVGDTIASASQSGTAGGAATFVRVTQEVLEAVVLPQPHVRVTQEVVEVVLAGEPPVGWTVEAHPLVLWGKRGGGGDDDDGIIVTDPTRARGKWRVVCGPRVKWGATVTSPATRWKVETAPQVTWDVGPGTVDTDCLSAPGEMPEPEPGEPGLEQNYVF